MSYSLTPEELEAQIAKFKSDYPEFKPFRVKESSFVSINKKVQKLVSQQNGPDFDDYIVVDNGKVKKYTEKLFNPGSKMLLLGTGSGREILAALDMGYDAYGTTLGSRNIKYSSFIGVDQRRIFECLNEDLPFPNNYFDIVCGFQVFEHAFSPSLFLLESNRVLKTGGVIVLEWPMPSEQTGDENPHHQICYTPGQAVALLKKNGYGNISVYYDSCEPIDEKLYWSGLKEEHKSGHFVIYGTKV